MRIYVAFDESDLIIFTASAAAAAAATDASKRLMNADVGISQQSVCH